MNINRRNLVDGLFCFFLWWKFFIMVEYCLKLLGLYGSGWSESVGFIFFSKINNLELWLASRHLLSSIWRCILIRWGWHQKFFSSLLPRLVILWLPVGPLPPSSLSKVSSDIEMLLLSCNLRLHPSPGISPVFHHLLCLFFSPLVGQFFIFRIEPVLFHFLLKRFSRWIVKLVVGSALKTVFFAIRNLVLCGREVCGKWIVLLCSVILFKLRKVGGTNCPGILRHNLINTCSSRSLWLPIHRCYTSCDWPVSKLHFAIFWYSLEDGLWLVCSVQCFLSNGFALRHSGDDVSANVLGLVLLDSVSSW